VAERPQDRGGGGIFSCFKRLAAAGRGSVHLPQLPLGGQELRELDLPEIVPDVPASVPAGGLGEALQEQGHQVRDTWAQMRCGAQWKIGGSGGRSSGGRQARSTCASCL